MLADGQQAPSGNRVAAFDMNQLMLTEHDGVARQPGRRFAQHHPVRWRHRLHALGHADFLADGGVSQRPRTDRAGDHLAGIEAYPHPQVQMVEVSDFAGEPLRRFLQAQGRHTGPNRVVLQRYGRAEHGHDAVAGELVHGAAVTLHHRHRAINQLGHDLAQPLGTHRRGDVHRMHHVGEQNSHLLVLAMFGRVREARTALATELGRRGQSGAARTAREAPLTHGTATVAVVVHPSIVSPPVSDVPHIAVPSTHECW